MNKRQLAAQNTKRKLITAALELIKENGFDIINVEDITRKAGVAKGTFYTYFKRKEDIVLDISRVPFSEIVDELLLMESMEITKKLTHYCKRFMECVESCGINICRQWIRDVIDPNHVPNNKDSQNWNFDVEMLKTILENTGMDKELKPDTPIELLTHVIICELYGMMTCWCMSDGTFEPLDWVERFCDVQLEKILEQFTV